MPELDLADFPVEGENAFKETETTTPSDSPTDNKSEDDTSTKPETISEESSPSDEKEDGKPLPFHKDPAIQDYLNRQIESRTAKIREEVEESISSKLAPKEPANIPSWFSRIYGEDAVAWQEYRSYEDSKLARVKDETIREYESRQMAEQEKILKANQYIDDSLEALRKEGKKFDKNELLKVVSDYRPINESGNWDIQKAYEILELKKARPEKSAAKKVAAAASSDTRAEAPVKNVFTYDEIKKRGWNSY